MYWCTQTGWSYRVWKDWLNQPRAETTRVRINPGPKIPRVRINPGLNVRGVFFQVRVQNWPNVMPIILAGRTYWYLNLYAMVIPLIKIYYIILLLERLVNFKSDKWQFLKCKHWKWHHFRWFTRRGYEHTLLSTCAVYISSYAGFEL